MIKYSSAFTILVVFYTFTLINCGPSVISSSILEDADLFFNKPDLPPSMNQTEGCGGVLSAQRGYLGYRMNSTYRNNERCIWTIRTDKVATMMQIRWHGFVTDDHISVYTLNKSGSLQLIEKLNKYTGNKWHQFLGPVIFLTFTSDQYNEGSGFYLEYFGFAYTETTGYAINNYRLEGESGSVSHPPPEFPTNEQITYVLHPVPNKSLQISIGHIDVGKMYAGCPHNYFSVHQLFQSTFDLRLRYCEPSLEDKAIIRSSSPILITFFATTSPFQTGFSFSWNMVENK